MNFYLSQSLLLFSFLSMTLGCGSAPFSKFNAPAPATDGPVTINGEEKNLSETTNAAGATEATYDPAVILEQAITVNTPNLPTSGTKVLLPRGFLPQSTKILIETADIEIQTIANVLAITGEVYKRSNPISVTAVGDLFPVVPFKVSLPITAARDASAKLLVVFYQLETSEGRKVGIISPDKLVMSENEMLFESDYFGQFQLAEIPNLPAVMFKQYPKAGATTEEVESVNGSGSSVIAQHLYLTGINNSHPGYWVDGVWSELTNGVSGLAKSYTMQFNTSGDMYVAGTNSTNLYDFGQPGYWKNGVWTNLTLPATYNACSYPDIAISSSGHVHAIAQCENNNGDSIGLYWLDGSPSILPFSEAGLNYIIPMGISLDSAGHVYIPVEESSVSNLILNGVYKDGVFSELSRTTIYNNKKLAISAAVFDATGHEYMTGLIGSDLYASGYWKDRVWTPSAKRIGTAKLSAAGDLYIPAATATSFGYYKNGTYVSVTAASAVAGSDLEISHIGIFDNGDVYLLGTQWDASYSNQVLTGYWKNGVWQEMSRNAAGLTNSGVYHLTVH